MAAWRTFSARNGENVDNVLIANVFRILYDALYKDGASPSDWKDAAGKIVAIADAKAILEIEEIAIYASTPSERRGPNGELNEGELAALRTALRISI